MVSVTPISRPSPMPVRTNLPHECRMSRPARLIMAAAFQSTDHLDAAVGAEFFFAVQHHGVAGLQARQHLDPAVQAALPEAQRHEAQRTALGEPRPDLVALLPDARIRHHDGHWLWRAA